MTSIQQSAIGNRHHWYLVALVTIVALIYGRTVTYDFVYDDAYFVVQNTAIRQWSSIPSYFVDRTTYVGPLWPGGMYRPLRNISYLADYKIAGLHPGWYHAHNVILHAIAACLVYGLLVQLMRVAASTFGQGVDVRKIAFLAAVAWSVHPVLTEVVAWVKSRDEVLFTVFYLAGIMLFVRGLSSEISRWRFALGAIACFAASQLSKEMAVSFPILCVVVYWLYGKPTHRVWAGGVCAATGALALLFIITRHRVLGQTQQVGYLAGGFWPEMYTMLGVMTRYLQLLIYPSNLVVSYDWLPAASNPWNLRTLLGLSMVVISCLTGFLYRKSLPMLALGIAWFWITILPVSNLIPTMQHMAERFLYLPSIGIVMSVSAVVLHAATNSVNAASTAMIRRSLAGVAIMACVALVAGTSIRLLDWNNNLTLFGSALEVVPNSARMIRCYATALVNAGHPSRAVPYYERLLTQSWSEDKSVPEYITQQGYGLALAQLGRYDEAVLHSRRALALNPDDVETYRHLAFSLWKNGETTAALATLDDAQLKWPSYSQLVAQRNIVLSADGKTSGTVGGQEK